MGSGPDLNGDGVCHHYSRDSAIDSELHDFDSEMLEVDLVISEFQTNVIFISISFNFLSSKTFML